MRLINAVLLVTLFGGIGFAQNQDNQNSPKSGSGECSHGLSLIEADRPGALKDSSLVRCAEATFRDHAYHIGGLGASAQQVLARIGKKEALFEIACESRYGDGHILYDAVESKLPYVGGAFAIRELSLLLKPNKRNSTPYIFHDDVLRPPKDQALKPLYPLVGDESVRDMIRRLNQIPPTLGT